MALRATIRFALLFAIGLPLTECSWAQLKPGVVVEEIGGNSGGDKAGLKQGDLLLTWFRGDVKGNFESPFDLAQIEIEQEPRGPVTLEGLSGTEHRTWVMGPDRWGLETRPQLREKLLVSFRQGQESAKAGNLDNAAERWRQAAKEAKEIQSPSSSWLSVWFSFHLAEVLSNARQWKEADLAFESLIQQETGAEPELKAQFLRRWAYAYEGRGDWGNASKYYEKALAEDQKSGNETLVSAKDRVSLANAIFRQGDLNQAEEYLQQALAVSKKLAPTSLDVATGLTVLGKVLALKGDVGKAEEDCRQALDIRQKLVPGGLDVASSFFALGNVAYVQGDLTKAEDYYQQSLAIREKLDPDSRDFASNLANLGNTASARGDLGRGEAYYARELALREKLQPGTIEVGESLNHLGSVAYRRGDLVKAEQYYTQALSIEMRLSPESLNTAGMIFNLGMVSQDHGDLFKAEDYYRQALKMFRKVAPDSANVAFPLTTLGDLARSRGDLAKADEFYQGALALDEKTEPESINVAWTVDSLGIVAKDRGDLAKANEYFQRALAIREKIAPGSLDIAVSCRNLGDLFKDQNDFPKAEEYYQKAITIQRKQAPDSLNLAVSIQALGNVFLARNDISEAESSYGEALAIREKLAPGSKEHAESLVALARIMGRQQRLADADRLYQQGLDAFEHQITRLGGSDEVRADFRAKYESYYKDYIALLMMQKQPERALRVLERWRARTLLGMLAAANVDIRKGVDPTLLQQEHSLQAGLNARSSRRLELLDKKHTDEQLAAFDKDIARLLEEYKDVEGQIRLNSPGYAALTQPQPLSAEEIQKQLLQPGILLLEYSLGEEHSYLFALTANSIHAYELPNRATVEKSARELYQLLRTWRNPAAAVTAGKSQPGTTESEFSRKSRLSQRAAALSQMVLGPAASEIHARRLLIVSDGALQYIPFSVLPEPEETGTKTATHSGQQLPLMVEHEVVNLPSASVLTVLRQQAAARKAPAKMVAVLADPVFDKGDERIVRVQAGKSPNATRSISRDANPDEDVPATANGNLLERLTRSWTNADRPGDPGFSLARLPYTRREAHDILAVTPPDAAMEALDFDASRATAMDPKLAEYRMVHFATHSYSDSEHPELSALLFSMVDQRGNAQDGLVGLQDIYNLNLPADLVVLSACETGVGKEIKGEGLMGLTRGFMYAGATRVAASLWKVDDVATAELMRRFYTAMEREKMRPAAALQKAQVEMWRQPRWRDPYYWAGFELQGEWK